MVFQRLIVLTNLAGGEVHSLQGSNIPSLYFLDQLRSCHPVAGTITQDLERGRQERKREQLKVNHKDIELGYHSHQVNTACSKCQIPRHKKKIFSPRKHNVVYTAIV